MAEQLPRRSEDFKSLMLPTAGDWEQRKAGMTRAAQVEYLVRRLRLLNCRQWGQPGDVDHTDDQYVETYSELENRWRETRGEFAGTVGHQPVQ